MDKLFYTNETLTEKSSVPQGSDLPVIYFELLEYDLSSLPKDVTIYDIEWTSEGGVVLPTDEQYWFSKVEEKHNQLIVASKDYLISLGYHLDMRESLNLHESRGNETQRTMSEQVADFIKIVQNDLCLRMVDIQSGICELDLDFTNNNSADPQITWSDLKLAGLIT